jgi:DNA-binding IclR family transcriptional regulator
VRNSNESGDIVAVPKKPQPAGIQSVEISIGILDAFAQRSSPMSLKQVCQALDMAPSKVHRYLVSFVRCGMLTQFTSNGLYDLGPAARSIGLAAMGRLDYFVAASRELLWLRDTTGHTACLSVWGDSGPTMIRWEEGEWPLFWTIRVGSVLPLSGTAIGNTFLAHLPSQVTEPVLKSHRQFSALKREASLPSKKELMEIRASRSIYLQSAVMNEIDAIAAPTFDRGHNLSSVICLLAPHHALAGSEAQRCRRHVEEAAHRVSYELGYDPARR